MLGNALRAITTPIPYQSWPGFLERGRGRCARCGAVAEYEVIDMTGDGSRMDRQWRCAENHRDTRVQDQYPQYKWENRRGR